jgi:hypothetical protein
VPVDCKELRTVSTSMVGSVNCRGPAEFHRGQLEVGEKSRDLSECTRQKVDSMSLGLWL